MSSRTCCECSFASSLTFGFFSAACTSMTRVSHHTLQNPAGDTTHLVADLDVVLVSPAGVQLAALLHLLEAMLGALLGPLADVRVVDRGLCGRVCGQWARPGCGAVGYALKPRAT